MPPPRLTRPPWPCHLPWSTRQVRWAVHGPRRKLSTRRGDNTQTAHQSNDAQSGAQEAGSPSPQETSSPTPNGSELRAHQGQNSWWKSLLGPATFEPNGVQSGTSHEPNFIITEQQKPSPLTQSTQQFTEQNKQIVTPQPPIPPSDPLIEHPTHFVSLKSKEGHTEDNGSLPKVSQILQTGKETKQPEQKHTTKESEALRDTARIVKHFSQKGPDLPLDPKRSIICYHCGRLFSSSQLLRAHLKKNKGAYQEHAINKSRAPRTSTSGRFKIVKDEDFLKSTDRHPPGSAEPTSDPESSSNINLELRKQIEHLREEIRQLRELYENKSTITPQPENPELQLKKQTNPPSLVSTPKRGRFNTPLINSQAEEPHGNSKMSPTSSSNTIVSRDSPELRCLKKARKRLKHTVSTLSYAYSSLIPISSPQLQPLAGLIDETLDIFERDFMHFFSEHNAGKFVSSSRARRRNQEEVLTDNLSGSTSTSSLPLYSSTQSGHADQGHTTIQPAGGSTLKAAAEEDAGLTSLDNTGVENQNPVSRTIGSQILNDAIVRNEAQLQVIQALESPYGDTQRLIRSLHTQASSQRTPNFEERLPQSEDESISKESLPSDLSEQSLLEELFPEANSYIQPHYTTRNPYPRLDPPKEPVVRSTYSGTAKSQRQRIIEAFQSRGEQLTVLQLTNCSTELTEADFRRLIPKGKHIESWARNGEFHKIIPGRDPLSLERLPFYYLIFKTPESALAYQNNVARLHKLSSLHQPSSIFSAIPPPKGFLEDGEDLNAVMSSYLLKPTTLKLNLNVVMQPYNPSLRALIEQGGYNPIVPNTDENGHKIWKVLLHIEGWEPLREDLYHVFTRHAYDRGLSWPFHKDILGISKLRDLVDVKQKFQAGSSLSSASSTQEPSDNSLEDFSYSSLNVDPLEQSGDWKGSISQVVMNRLYNRWIIEFGEEDAARRFARMWHRRILPTPKLPSWRDTEEPRMISAEVLW